MTCPSKTSKFARRQRDKTDNVVLAELETGNSSKVDLARVTGISPRTILESIKRLRADKKVRIAAYERTANDFRPIYGLGDAPDVKEPKPYTQREMHHRHRAKHLGLLRLKQRSTTGMQAFYSQLIARTA